MIEVKPPKNPRGVGAGHEHRRQFVNALEVRKTACQNLKQGSERQLDTPARKTLGRAERKAVNMLEICRRCTHAIIEMTRGASRRRMRVAWTFSKEKDIFKSQCPSVFPVDKIEKIKIENFVLFIILCVSVCVSE